MFEDLIKHIQSLNGRQVSIPIEADENGYIDKQCPSKQCEFLFKVNQEDWSNIFKNEAVWCPMCRHEAPSNQWFTIAQIAHAKSEALAILKGEIHNALLSDAERFNRRHSQNSFISISLNVNGGIQRTHTLPAKAADVMQLAIQCDRCSARFAVIGSAYFCPACGADSVIRTYQDSLRKIKSKIDSEDTIRQALTETLGRDKTELTCRSLVESCISDGVTAFQKYCEGVFKPYGEAQPNVFQRIDDGSELWRSVTGKGYDSWLTHNELNDLKILFQKRHILIHNEGIIDNRYIDKSGDQTYRQGQRLVVSKNDIVSLLNLLEKLGNALGGSQNDV